MALYPIQYEEGVDKRAYLGKKGWTQGHILGEITDLEFENQKNMKTCIYCAFKKKMFTRLFHISKWQYKHAVLKIVSFYPIFFIKTIFTVPSIGDF